MQSSQPIFAALMRWQGAREISLPTCPGVLVEPLVNHGERRHFMRVIIEPTGQVRRMLNGLRRVISGEKPSARNSSLPVRP